MPRLRTVKKPEDSADIPVTESVAVILEGAPETTPEPATPPETVAPPPPAPPPEQPQVNEATQALQKQLTDIKRSHEQAIARAEEAQRRYDAAQQQLHERDTQLHESNTQKATAEYEAVVNALGAAEAESEAASRDFEAAHNNGDPKALAEAQKRISRAQAQIVRLEESKADVETRRERAKTEPPKPPQVAVDPIEAHINAIPGLQARERQWLRDHTDVLTDARKNAKLQSLHFDAEDAGHKRGSDGYFEFFEEKLGYRQPAAPPPADEDEPVTVAAPVSREAPSTATGRPASSNRVVLSPEQREAARMAGVDEVTYARQYQRMLEQKKQGMHNDR